MKLNIQLFADAEVSIKFNNKIGSQKKLERYAETLTKINSVLSGLNTGVMKQLDSSAASIGSINNDVKDISNRVGVAFNVTAISRFAGAIKKLGAGFTSLAKQSFDYLENFNLFQVAFKGNYNSAERFINKMSEMYGLDESWLTQTTGKFKQLTNAMQLSEETGEKVSKLLTQMSLDISSLYNVDIERAASTLSSAMAGQTKPIRGVAGADITQTTLQTTLDQLDIDTTVNKLSFAEKRLLIIISLTKQLNASIGDMGRTIESPSNQLRIMNEQWERLSRAVGNVFLPILSKILPYLNAILMVITEIISAIAVLVGYKRDDFDYFDSAATGAWDLDEGIKSAGASAKKLKQGLRGFDKLNNITTPNAGGSGGGVGGGGINPKLMEAFNKAFDDYQSKLGNVNMKATQIRDKIMEWLGFTKQIDEKTGDVSFKLKKGYSNFKLIVNLIATLMGFKLLKGLKGLITGTSRLGQLLGTGTIFNFFKNLPVWLGNAIPALQAFTNGTVSLGTALSAMFPKFAKLGIGIGGLNTTVLAATAAVVALAAAFIYAYKNNDEFREKVDKLAKTIKQTLKPLLDTLTTILKTLWEGILEPLWQKVIKPLGEFLLNVFVAALGQIVDWIQKLWSFLEPLTPFLEKMVNTYLTWLIEKSQKLKDKISEIIDKLKTAYNDYIKPIYKYVKETLFPYLEEKFEPIKKALEEINGWLNKISGTKKVEIDANTKPFKNKLKDIAKSMGNGVLTALFPNVSGIYSKIMALQKGGMPDVGQLFVANEKGPELVGQIGGKSFVANQNQMMDLLDRKLGQTNANPINATFVIQVGNKEIAKQVINDLQGMAKSNGKPITIGG